MKTTHHQRRGFVSARFSGRMSLKRQSLIWTRVPAFPQEGPRWGKSGPGCRVMRVNFNGAKLFFLIASLCALLIPSQTRGMVPSQTFFLSFLATDSHGRRHSGCPSVRPVLVFAISQLHLDGISSNSAQCPLDSRMN